MGQQRQGTHELLVMLTQVPQFFLQPRKELILEDLAKRTKQVR